MKSIISGLVMAAAMLWSGASSAALLGVHTDTFGHTGNDIAYNLRDIRSTGTLAPGASSCDDCVSPAINLGFSFNFYGNSYSQVYLSSNGFLSFDSTVSTGCCSANPVTTGEGVQNAIEGLWNDLYPPGGGTVRYQTLGSAGSREFVFGFYGVPQCCSSPPEVSFEIILHEGSNNIEFQYESGGTDGSPFGIGIENANDTDGLQVLLSSSATLSRQGYLITTSTVPEPTSMLLAGVALVGIGAARRRRGQSGTHA